ncbi:uncharacterized protein LOC141536078 [Cotesia typhae]|uniref:uncharacterized protein LOC141536078 n=1 Tax=Cotesia typhae TaxID=2053667 RepID=UPI003D69962D
MYPTKENFAGNGTWYQIAISVYGKKDVERGVRLLRRLARPITPVRALRAASRLVDVFERLPSEVLEAASFFYVEGLEGVGGPWALEEVMATNAEDLERLAAALMDAVFFRLVTGA